MQSEPSKLGYVPQPIRKDGAGAYDLGPRDVMRDLENPDMFVPPSTDEGLVPNLVFSFSDAHMQLNKGGWSREVTIRELPIATTLAGVNMALTPGGVREMHWHSETEWAYVLKGSARVTSVDQNGRNFIGDISVGDLWFFPKGVPHTIQGLENGCEFILIFNDGNFSDLNTFSITDWFAHTPKDLLAQNFVTSESTFANIPSKQRYIYQSNVPGPIESQKVPDPNGTVPLTFKHRLLSQVPLIFPYGTVRIVDSINFPISTTTAAALVEIKPGAMREMHWHFDDEWQYYISGSGRMTVFAGNGNARTFNVRAGDVGYIPFPYGHFIQNTGDCTIWFLETFRAARYADISLSQWMALTPPEIVSSNLNLNPEFVKSLPKQKIEII
jgi:oxalate decarboxylase